MSDTALTTTMKLGPVEFPTISLPKSLPVPKPVGRSREHLMRDGRTGPGIRVIQFLGSHPSYDNVNFSLYKVTNNQLTSLETLFRAQKPFIWKVDFGNGSSWEYRVTFADDGFEPYLPDLAGYDAHVYIVDIKLRIMENLG